jgi:hypothetical protein
MESELIPLLVIFRSLLMILWQLASKRQLHLSFEDDYSIKPLAPTPHCHHSMMSQHEHAGSSLSANSDATFIYV